MYNSSDSVKNDFELKGRYRDQTPLENTNTRRLVKRATIPCVVWAEEPKTGVGFEIGPRQQTL